MNTYLNLLPRFIELRYSHFIFLLFFAVVLFSGSGLQLWDQDESAYAGMARQMLQSGNWLLPEFTWSEVHRKPPFHIWNIAIAFQLFGIHEYSVRISSIIYVVLTAYVVYLLVLRFENRKTAFLSMVLVCTSFLIPMLARIAVTDGTLLFFFTVCVYAVYRQLEQASFRWVLLFWISFALALMTKGPPIIIFTSIFCFLLVVFHPSRKKIIQFHPWIGLPLACLPLVWWAYQTTLLDGGKLLDWMIDFYVLKRFSNSMFGQTGPPGTHLLIILISFLPYLVYLPGTFRQTYLECKAKHKDTIFLAAWFVSAWLIYEFSPSKLPSYTVSAHIPLAILVARYSAVSLGEKRLYRILHLGFNLLLFLTLIALPLLLDFPREIKISWSILAAIMLLCTWIVARTNVSEHKVFVYASAGLLFQVGINVFILPSFDPLKLNTREVALVCGSAPVNSLALIGNDTGLPPSLPFYLTQSVAEVKPEYYVKEWVSAYYSDRASVLILNDKQYTALVKFIPEDSVELVPSYHLEHLTSFNYYLVKNNKWENKPKDTSISILVQAPTKGLSVKELETNILASKEWMVSMAKKAKERKISVREMVYLDAVYMNNHENEVYRLELKIRQSSEWLQYLNAKAKKQQVSLESMVHEEARQIVDLHNIQ